MRWPLLLLAGCFTKPELMADARPLDAALLCPLADNFDDNALAPEWMIQDTAQTFVVITEENQQLQLAPRVMVDGYNAVYARDRYDMTGATLTVQVEPTTQAGYAETGLYLQIDVQNQVYITTGAGRIVMGTTQAGTDARATPLYNAMNHRFWQLRHDARTRSMHFELSSDGMTWQAGRGPVVVSFDITALAIGIQAGSFQGGTATPGIARYDDFTLCH
jgi:hypothetical protein